MPTKLRPTATQVAGFTYPKDLLLRRVNNSGDTSWHKNRVFISEVFASRNWDWSWLNQGFTESSFETWRPENSTWKSFALEPHDEWSEFPDECIGL
jgi:hypothetical protein